MATCSCGGGPPVALPLGEAAPPSGHFWIAATLGAGLLGFAAYAAMRGGGKKRRRRRVEIYEGGGRRRYTEV